MTPSRIAELRALSDSERVSSFHDKKQFDQIAASLPEALDEIERLQGHVALLQDALREAVPGPKHSYFELNHDSVEHIGDDWTKPLPRSLHCDRCESEVNAHNALAETAS